MGSYRSFCLKEGPPCQHSSENRYFRQGHPILQTQTSEIKNDSPKANLFGGKRKLPNSHAKCTLIYSLRNTTDSVSGGAMKKQESSTQHFTRRSELTASCKKDMCALTLEQTMTAGGGAPLLRWSSPHKPASTVPLSLSQSVGYPRIGRPHGVKQQMTKRVRNAAGGARYGTGKHGSAARDGVGTSARVLFFLELQSSFGRV